MFKLHKKRLFSWAKHRISRNRLNLSRFPRYNKNRGQGHGVRHVRVIHDVLLCKENSRTGMKAGRREEIGRELRAKGVYND